MGRFERIRCAGTFRQRILRSLFMRKSAMGFWIGAVILIIVGAAVGGLYSDRAAACQSTLGVAAQSSSDATANCVLSFVAVHLGQGMMLIGALVGLVAVGFTVRRSMQGPPRPGWYPQPGFDRPVFWDGERWVV
jgi:hypothetical protein